MNISIAIDGPAGAGKSTISKLLADKINFNYLDTGAMYRAYTYYYLSNGIDVENEEEINNNIKNINLSIEDSKFFLNGKDVSKEIRSQEVTKNVSLVSSYIKVRENLVKSQQSIASKSNIILDGRDIGSNVLKDADMKFFLTASPEVRAKRRMDQNNDNTMTYEETLADINRRDHFDSNRKISPLVIADDAIIIDSSDLNIEEVVDVMISYLEKNHVI